MEIRKNTMVTALKLPKDVVLGEVLVSFVGRHSVIIENYRSILFYTDTEIKLQAKNCRVHIHGVRLKVEYYNSQEMKITGQMRSIDFV